MNERGYTYLKDVQMYIYAKFQRCKPSHLKDMRQNVADVLKIDGDSVASTRCYGVVRTVMTVQVNEVRCFALFYQG